MKIRTDFVSNSSSCSFMVMNIRKLMEVLAPLGQMPYQYDDFNITIHCKHKDLKKVHEAFICEPYKEPIPDMWWYKQHNIKYVPPKPDDDENLYIEDYNTFLCRYEDAPDDVKDAIYEFSISCDDYNDAHKGLLNMIYDLCEKEGLNPSDEHSEIGFRPGKEKYDNFFTRLSMKLMEHKEQEQCQKHSKTK